MSGGAAPGPPLLARWQALSPAELASEAGRLAALGRAQAGRPATARAVAVAVEVLTARRGKM